MTNDEAIAIIQNEYKCVDRDCDIERSCGNCNLMMSSKEPILEAYKLAIKALEQQPCEDAVSREDALMCLTGMFKLHLNYNPEDLIALFSKRIKALPSVTQKSGKWIPFSERLPKPFEHCLITTTDGEVIYHYDDGHYSKYKAWMPLPEPYKVENEDGVCKDCYYNDGKAHAECVLCDKAESEE